jgi:hypothetical protein
MPQLVSHLPERLDRVWDIGHTERLSFGNFLLWQGRRMRLDTLRRFLERSFCPGK